jgi:MFS family permease
LRHRAGILPGWLTVTGDGMTALSSQNPWFHKWLVFGAVSLAFFFVNFSTFASLGVVLFTMIKDLHWSNTAAGWSFSFLGLSCGLASPLPALTMKWIGGRATMGIGTVLLVVGFFLASISHSLAVFDVAIILVGTGFTFVGNVPGVFWIAAWFGRGSPRVIGIYMMLGAAGAALAPPVVNAIASEGGWRLHWRLMAIVAALVGGACLALVGNRRADSKSSEPTETARPTVEPPTAVEQKSGWTTRQAMFTWQSLLIAAAHVATMISVTTTHSMVVSHLVKLGSSSAAGSLALAAISLTAVLIKAVTGYLCERFRPKSVIAVGLLLQASGNAMLAFADTPALQFIAAVAFGAGWGLSIVAGMVLPLDFFGGLTGPRVLSIIALLTTFAAAGPIGAGMIADHFGTFTPVFVLFAGLQLVVAVPIFMMRRPVSKEVRLEEQGADLVRTAEAV